MLSVKGKKTVTIAGFTYLSKLGPILAGAPCLDYPGKEGYVKNRLTVRK